MCLSAEHNTTQTACTQTHTNKHTNTHTYRDVTLEENFARIK